MRASCVSYPEKEPLILIRKSQLALCDQNHCAAALLSFFEHWHNIKLGQQQQAEHANRVARMHGEEGTQDVSLFQYHTEEGLESGLLELYGRTMIRRGLNILTAKGFVSVHENPNTRYRFDKTHYFLFHPDKVSSQLIDIAHEVKIPDGDVKNNAWSGKNTSSSVKNTSSLTELSSELSFRDSSVSNETETHARATQDEAPGQSTEPAHGVPRTKKAAPRAKKPQRLRTDYTPGFQAWWAAYPPDKRVSKPACFTVWLALGLESRADELREKVVRLTLTTWAKVTDRKYIKTSLPYLNEGRYEDELVPFNAARASPGHVMSEKGMRNVETAQRIMQEDTDDADTGSPPLLSSAHAHGRIFCR